MTVRICDNCEFQREDVHQPDLFDSSRASTTLHITATRIAWCYGEPERRSVPFGRPACVHFKARES